MEQLMINWGYVIVLFILGFITYKRKALDFLGSLVMIIMGIVIIFSAGINWLLLILIFLLLSLLATRYSKTYKRSLGEFEGRRTSKNVISNGIVACMMAAFGGYYLPFVGGFRLWHVVFPSASSGLSFGYYLRQPWLILAVWNGGLGIPGTIIGGAMAMALFCRRYGFRAAAFFDAAAPGLALGQAVGRLGNYFNQEL